MCSQFLYGFINFTELIATLLMKVIVEIMDVWILVLLDVSLVLLDYSLLASLLH